MIAAFPLRAWWSACPRGERLAWLVLVALLATGLAGGRWWPRHEAHGLVHRVGLIELAVGGDADRTSPGDRLLPPCARGAGGGCFLLGSDELGRSLGLRLAAALGTSIAIAIAAALVALVIGTGWGVAAALLGGRWDGLLMRTAEVTAAVPGVVVIMVVVSALQAYGPAVIFAAMGLLYWQQISRVVRARVLRLRGEQYVEASRAIGAGLAHRLRVHLLPALAPTVLTYGALLLPRLIMLEGLLSFLGVSGSAAGPHSFGRIIAGLTSTLTPLSLSWWPVLIACAVMAAFLLALTVVLDARTASERGRPGE
jgi:ABC-type dipeptide/oligopeptide/nickel transport system permease subunit